MSREYEEMQVEKWVNLEDVAEHLSISQDTVRTLSPSRQNRQEKG